MSDTINVGDVVQLGEGADMRFGLVTTIIPENHTVLVRDQEGKDCYVQRGNAQRIATLWDLVQARQDAGFLAIQHRKPALQKWDAETMGALHRVEAWMKELRAEAQGTP